MKNSLAETRQQITEAERHRLDALFSPVRQELERLHLAAAIARDKLLTPGELTAALDAGRGQQ